jgi:hypothetical protein
VVDEAVNMVVNVVHVNTVGGAMAAFGAVIFCVTVTVAVLLQLLDGSVTVTV